MLMRKYSTSELLDLGKTFEQGMKGALTAWPMRLADVRVCGFHECECCETEKLSSVTTHPSLRQRSHKRRQHEGISPRWTRPHKPLGTLCFHHAMNIWDLRKDGVTEGSGHVRGSVWCPVYWFRRNCIFIGEVRKKLNWQEPPDCHRV